MAAPLLRQAQSDLAIAKILDGAGRAFVEHGVSRSGMAEIAKFAGCSRGTLYRYFKNRHELHLEFVVNRAARVVTEVTDNLKHVEDPRQRLIEYTLGSIKLVRDDPALAAWFEPDESGATARMGRGNEVIDRFVSAFVGELQGVDQPTESTRLRARYLVRIIMSLLAMPGESAEEERLVIERFVVPSVLGDEPLVLPIDLGSRGSEAS